MLLQDLLAPPGSSRLFTRIRLVSSSIWSRTCANHHAPFQKYIRKWFYQFIHFIIFFQGRVRLWKRIQSSKGCWRNFQVHKSHWPMNTRGKHLNRKDALSGCQDPWSRSGTRSFWDAPQLFIRIKSDPFLELSVCFSPVVLLNGFSSDLQEALHLIINEFWWKKRAGAENLYVILQDQFLLQEVLFYRCSSVERDPDGDLLSTWSPVWQIEGCCGEHLHDLINPMLVSVQSSIDRMARDLNSTNP